MSSKVRLSIFDPVPLAESPGIKFSLGLTFGSPPHTLVLRNLVAEPRKTGIRISHEHCRFSPSLERVIVGLITHSTFWLRLVEGSLWKLAAGKEMQKLETDVELFADSVRT